MRRAAITDRSPHGPPYKRHRPDGPTPRQTLLYQIIERHYPAFREVMAAQGKPLPLHVHRAIFATSLGGPAKTPYSEGLPHERQRMLWAWDHGEAFRHAAVTQGQVAWRLFA